MASLQMLKARTVARPVPSNRRSAVRVRAIGYTSDTGRTAEVREYLESLPGQGRRSGPFDGVWDPLQLARSAQVADVRRWRESEIVHGRVAMLAALGWFIGEQVEDFPAFAHWDSHVSGPAIQQWYQAPWGFRQLLVAGIALAEFYRVAVGWAFPRGAGFNRIKGEYETGELGFDPLGLRPKEADKLWEMETKEINNGRLAMIAVTAFTVQEVLHPDVPTFQHWFSNVASGEAVKKAAELPQQLPDLPQQLPGLPSGIPQPQDLTQGLQDAPKNFPQFPDLTKGFQGFQDAPKNIPQPQDLTQGLQDAPKNLPQFPDLTKGFQGFQDAPKNIPQPQDLTQGLQDAPKNFPQFPDLTKGFQDLSKNIPQPQDLTKGVKGFQTPSLPDLTKSVSQLPDLTQGFKDLTRGIPTPEELTKGVQDFAESVSQPQDLTQGLQDAPKNLPQLPDLTQEFQDAPKYIPQAQDAPQFPDLSVTKGIQAQP